MSDVEPQMRNKISDADAKPLLGAQMQDNNDSTPESVSHGTEKNPRDGRGHHPNSRKNLIPFVKGGDPRANHKSAKL
jgi:hypothetical protein